MQNSIILKNGNRGYKYLAYVAKNPIWWRTTLIQKQVHRSTQHHDARLSASEH